MEGMQSTIYFLQQQLKEAKETIANLQKQSVEQKLVEEKNTVVEQIVVGEKEIDKVGIEEDDDLPDQLQSVEEEQENAKLDRSPETVEAAETVEASVEDEGEKEEEALNLRLGRRGRSTPTKSSSESPSKRGRATRGQKREVRLYCELAGLPFYSLFALPCDVIAMCTGCPKSGLLVIRISH